MTEHNFEHMRRAMVASQLRTTGVNDPRVLAALGEVPRERFVPHDRIAAAYADAVLPLGHGREMNSPIALGRLLTEASLTGDERAMVVGSAAGYAAAVVARLARSVVALEEEPALVASARSALAGTGVLIAEGPLTKGWTTGAPYDFILIDGAVEYVPQSLVDQLADGGTLACALLENGVSRLCIGRVVAGAFGLQPFSDTAAAVLPGFSKPRSFTF